MIFIFKFYNVVSVKKSCILCIEFNVFELVVWEMFGIKCVFCVIDYVGGWYWCGLVIYVIMCNNILKYL